MGLSALSKSGWLEEVNSMTKQELIAENIKLREALLSISDQIDEVLGEPEEGLDEDME